jgi:hypothetical protein
MPEAAALKKYYYPTDRVPFQYDRTTTANGWTERGPMGERELPRLISWAAQGRPYYNKQNTFTLCLST